MPVAWWMRVGGWSYGGILTNQVIARDRRFKAAISGAGQSKNPTPVRSQVSVEVENRNWSDITVYLMAGGLPQRLGMVTSLRTVSLAFPSQRLNAGSGVRLRALPVAGTSYTTETILVLPGQTIMWTLENDLDHSSLTVY